MLLALAALSLISWFWLLFFRGSFWLSGPTLPCGTTGTRPVRVTAVVPARNEAEHIAATLRSLVAQHFPGDLRVVLVDDNSSDGTGDLARRISAEDPRVTVVAGEPLPPGWTGKMWAVGQGLRHPEAAAADYILLTDADIVHEPHHVALLVAKAEADGVALVSEMVRLRCRTLAERATIPAFVFFFQMLYPFRWVGDRRHTTAAAAGGTMLVARPALDSIGVVDRIRAALIDDVALAREIKRAGYPIWLGHAEQAQSRRTYSGFGEVWSMVERTAYVQLRCSPALLLGTCIGMLLLYAVPVIAAFAAMGPTRWMGIAAWAIMAIAFQPTLRRYRSSPLWGLALPAIAMFYLAATCGSAFRFYRGRGGHWKDRTYPTQPLSEPEPLPYPPARKPDILDTDMTDKKHGFATRAIHAGQEPDSRTGAVNVPVYLTSTYQLQGIEKHRGWEYSRVSNPTRDALEESLASLEGGTSAHVFASGMAAIAALVTMLKVGDHVICGDNVYGGTMRLFSQVIVHHGIEFTYVDTSNPDNVRRAIRPATKLVHIETPTNPLMTLTDIRAVAAVCHQHGIDMSVDNTFMSPYFQRPIELGADIVMHSTTKFLNGHSDGLGGVLVVTKPEHAENFRFVQKCTGGILSPFESWLILRGVKTLPVRMRQHDANGRAVAAFLSKHPKVSHVSYPGLPDHPQHELAKRQMSGFGSMMSFEVGSRASAEKLLQAVRVCTNGESLGGVETLISHSATTTHAAVPADERQRLGITEGLVRISVGIEDIDDILADLDQALGKI